jgi:hypothetical protein
MHNWTESRKNYHFKSGASCLQCTPYRLLLHCHIVGPCV